MNEHESEVFELQQHLQAGQQLLKGMQKPWQAAPAAAECGLSPVAMAQHHAATGRAMSPATAALQEVWPDLNLSGAPLVLWRGCICAAVCVVDEL